MAQLEELTKGAAVKGILPERLVTVVDVHWHGSNALELTYKDSEGGLSSQLVYRDSEPDLEIVKAGSPWSFDGDGVLFRLVSEARRIRLAYLFDPYLAVHTSLVDPLPHQITAVYGEMIPRQPLRHLLADDPGAGKTIMAGLFIKELMARGDLHRCLVICPGMLVEQWQDELKSKFQLYFDILTNDKLEAAKTGNWFRETPLAICRLDKLSRDEDAQSKLEDTDWDLVIVDEAHKMSATFFGNETKYTKRYRLGQLVSGLTRHFLLMTATPHNGKEADFQLFLALLDGDRFEGKFRDGVHLVDTSDLMRRMVKEQLVKFDGSKLFPPRRAETVDYTLSPGEVQLYQAVTDYVREEFNRADALGSEGRKGTVGFALTILQRRLASSPEAIYRSLQRRRERLEKRLREERLAKRAHWGDQDDTLPRLRSEEDWDDFDEAPEGELEDAEEQIVDQATAARTIDELEAEIHILRRLEALALQVRNSGQDRKWEELRHLLLNNPKLVDADGLRRKLIVFTEQKDTLHYLARKIRDLLGKEEAVVTIHGGMGREDRRNSQERFSQDKETLILVATDAAGEGINLIRAHLMVNYDLPWNPNRLEQRFGRIHRIGQTEVCHMWNLVAGETREGDVYQRLLTKIENIQDALQGRVFDVLGQVKYHDRSLRELLVEAIRYGEDPEVRARITQIVEEALDTRRLEELLEEHALARTTMAPSKVQEVREQMERAEARRLQPHYVEAYFLEAFRRLAGSIHEREPRRYEITHTPAALRNRDRQIGLGEAVLQRYERVTFEKSLVSLRGKPFAEFLCPGHPLLDAVTDLIWERNADLLKRGATLVDENDPGEEIRVLCYLEHSIQDARSDAAGRRRIVSRRLQFVDLDGAGQIRSAGDAPYLDLRPIEDEEHPIIQSALESQGWLRDKLEDRALSYAVQELAPAHLREIKGRKEAWVDKTVAAVKDRLTKEITYWDTRAAHLAEQERAGRVFAKVNSQKAAQRRDDLQARLQKRLTELEQERRLAPLAPIVVGGALVVPMGLLARLKGDSLPEPAQFARETERVEALAMEAVMAAERGLGLEPRDVSKENRGYDIESRDPRSGALRFLEVKGRAAGADSVFVTTNEIRTALNSPDSFILAVVEVDGEAAVTSYKRRPFERPPDFFSTGVMYPLAKLLAGAEAPN